MSTATAGIMSTIELAEHFGVPESAVRSALDATGLAKRVGRNRAVHADDLPLVALALKARGHEIRPAGREVAASC